MNSRRRLLLLERILKERTDEKHSLSKKEIAEILEKEYNCHIPDRATIADDINAIIDSGTEIEIEHSTQNRYRYIDREFDKAELKLIIDAVLSSRFITKAKSNDLVKKLARLAGPDGEGLSRHTEVENRVRNGNKKLFLIIDTLHQAIEEDRQISFSYFKYNEKKEKILQHKGKPYLFNPFFLIWTGEYYYLVGSYANHPDTVASFRVDRILEVPIIQQYPRAVMPLDFNPERYLNGTIHMFGGANEKQIIVKLLCENSAASGIIDRFGLDTPIEILDAEHFIASIQVAPTSVLFGWIFGFGGKVRILEPEGVKTEYWKMVEGVKRKNVE